MLVLRACLSIHILVALGDLAARAQPTQLPVVWQLATPKVLPQALLEDQLGRECLYAALKSGGLAVFDLSNPTDAPKQIALVGTKQLAGLDVMHVAQQKELLFLALGDFFNANGANAGLAVVSVAKPNEPKVLSAWQSSEKLHGAAAVVVQGSYAYLGAMNHGVFIFDISNPKSITKVAAFLPDADFPLKKPNKVQHPNARGLAITHRYLYVAFDAGGLRIIDIENPEKPREVGRYINAGMGKKQQAYNNLAIDGTTAYVAIDYAGLEILDIRDPSQIEQVAWWNPWDAHTLKNLWFNSPGHTNQIEYDPKQRLVYLSAGDSDLLVLNVANLRQPKIVAQHGDLKDKRGVWGLTVSKEYVYLAYITAVVPFQGTWSGIKAVKR